MTPVDMTPVAARHDDDGVEHARDTMVSSMPGAMVMSMS